METGVLTARLRLLEFAGVEAERVARISSISWSGIVTSPSSSKSEGAHALEQRRCTTLSRGGSGCCVPSRSSMVGVVLLFPRTVCTGDG